MIQRELNSSIVNYKLKSFANAKDFNSKKENLKLQYVNYIYIKIKYRYKKIFIKFIKLLFLIITTLTIILILTMKSKAIKDTSINNVYVYVSIDNKKVKLAVDTNSKTINDLLNKKLSLKIRDMDKVEPKRSTSIKNNMNIKVIRVRNYVIKEMEPIEYYSDIVSQDGEIQDSQANINSDDSKVIQYGQYGLKEVTYKITTEDNKVVTANPVQENILKEAVPKIIQVKIDKTQTVSNNSDTESNMKYNAANTNSNNSVGNIKYKSKINVIATAYTADFQSTGKNPGDAYYGVTASGAIAKRDPNGYSSIAVDPSVIPIGTKLYIPGYGYGIAVDTGGAIKKNRIDLFYNTEKECYDWGVKEIEVYIL